MRSVNITSSLLKLYHEQLKKQYHLEVFTEYIGRSKIKRNRYQVNYFSPAFIYYATNCLFFIVSTTINVSFLHIVC